MEAKVYNQKGQEKGTINLPEAVFAAAWNGDLVHQVVTSMNANARTPVAHTKFRGEVSGGGKKPWKQKGTGRARHGSSRSPIWIGGGVTHGPRNDKDYSQKISKKMRIKALYVALSDKLRRGEILFVESFEPTEKKTKDALATIKNFAAIPGFERLTSKKKDSVFFAAPELSENFVKSFNNLPQLDIENIKNINPVDVVTHRYIVIVSPVESVAFLESRSRPITK